MPPKIASLIFFSIIVYLFWRDKGNNEDFSNALWVPFAWLFVSRSSSILAWLGFSFMYGSEDVVEGNPFYRSVYTLLIVLGLYVLKKRRVNWRTWFATNHSIWLYFTFALISIIWSDYPFVSFKRLIKASGTLIMALVFVTEINPFNAIWLVLKRLSFILTPLSVLFIKYYPKFGIAYHVTGARMYVGVTHQKNQLGSLCMLFLIFYLWDFLYRKSDKVRNNKHLHYTIYLIMLPMIVWPFYMANSATSLACFIAAAIILCIGKMRIFVKLPRRLMTYSLAGTIIFGIAQALFNIKDIIIAMLGRRPDLTTRVPMWADLLSMVKNPIVGYGYESFWLGERLSQIQSRWGALVQAHNGYIEMYLNMGAIGILFILWWAVSGLKNVTNYISYDYSVGIIRFCFICVVLLYNYTEAMFYGRSTLWMLFFIAVMNTPAPLNLSSPYSEKRNSNIS